MEHVDFGTQKAHIADARERLDAGSSDDGDLRASLDGIAGEAKRLERLVKRNRLDFASYLEMARQVNSQGLDHGKIESYVRNLLSGRLFATRVFLMREGTDKDREGMLFSLQGGVEIELDAGGAVAEWLVKVQTPFSVGSREAELEQHALLETMRGAKVEVIVPLVRTDHHRRDLKGMLLLGPKLNGEAYDDTDFEFMGFLAEMLAIALHNAYLYYRSTHDALTRVYTRGYLDVVLAQEISRTRRQLDRTEGQRPGLSVLMIDIDHFKQVNDSLGHQTGDAVLREVAQELARGLRDYDTLARYGGEEFVALLPDTPKRLAVEVAERLRSAVEGLESPFGEERPVTISLGVAGFPEDGTSMGQLLQAADESLYQSKQSGRNRVTVAGDDG